MVYHSKPGKRHRADTIFQLVTNELNALFTKKKNSAQAFREANDKFCKRLLLHPHDHVLMY